MNDDFLYRARPPLRRDFADQLYERVQRLPWWMGVWGGYRSRKLTIRNAFLALLIVAVAACTYAVTTPRNVHVDGFGWVQEHRGQRTLYAADSWNSSAPSVPSSPPSLVSVEVADEMLDGRLKFPTWVPEGYQLVNSGLRPPLIPSHWDTLVTWRREGSADGQGDLILYLRSQGIPPLEGHEESYVEAPRHRWEEVHFRNVTAILVKGHFDWRSMPPLEEWQDGKFVIRWSDDLGYSLHWHEDGIAYLLETYDRGLLPQELIKIAESFR